MDDPLNIPPGPHEGPLEEPREYASESAPGHGMESSLQSSVGFVSRVAPEWTTQQPGASGMEEASRRRNLRHNLLLLLSLTLAAFVLAAWILVRLDSPFGIFSTSPHEIHLRGADEREYRARFTLIRLAGRWWIDDVHWAEEASDQNTLRT